MKNVNAVVLSAASNGSANGSQIDASQLFQASFQFKGTGGDEAGTVKIQMSNDLCTDGTLPSAFVVANWSDVPNASSSITSGAGAPIILSTVSARWLRVVYTRSSGGAANKLIKATMFGVCV